MSGTSNWSTVAKPDASDKVPLPFMEYLRARARRRTPVDIEPQSLNLDIHPIFWEMPTDSALHDAFHPVLANNIIKSTWREDHQTCFCDFVLHHIQELMTPIDIENNCPEERHSFLEGLNRIFAEPIIQAIDEEISAPANITTVRESNAQMASET